MLDEIHREVHRYECMQSLYRCLPTKQTVKNIVFAVALIVALGAILSGVLALYKVAFFAQLNFVASQVLTYGGVGLAILAIALKIIDCRCKRHWRLQPFVRDPLFEEHDNKIKPSEIPSEKLAPFAPFEKFKQKWTEQSNDYPFLAEVKKLIPAVNSNVNSTIFLCGLQGWLKGL